jgi:hypothetical protein
MSHSIFYNDLFCLITSISFILFKCANPFTDYENHNSSHTSFYGSRESCLKFKCKMFFVRSEFYYYFFFSVSRLTNKYTTHNMNYCDHFRYLIKRINWSNFSRFHEHNKQQKDFSDSILLLNSPTLGEETQQLTFVIGNEILFKDLMEFYLNV